MATRPSQTTIPYGRVRQYPGKIDIYTEKGWTPYPKLARDFMGLATLNGWTVLSTGLPIRFNSDGDLIVAVLVGRPQGTTPEGKTSPGLVLRVPWVCEHVSFRLGNIVIKQDRRGWRDVKSLNAACQIVSDHPVIMSALDAPTN